MKLVLNQQEARWPTSSALFSSHAYYGLSMPWARVSCLLIVGDRFSRALLCDSHTVDHAGRGEREG